MLGMQIFEDLFREIGIAITVMALAAFGLGVAVGAWLF